MTKGEPKTDKTFSFFLKLNDGYSFFFTDIAIVFFITK